MRRALVLRHHLEDDAGLIGAAFARRDFELRTVMVDAEHRAPTSVDADVMVILGSNNSVYDVAVQRTWLAPELDLIAAADAGGVAILGICFGAQVLCHAFGGEVVPADSDEIGWLDIDVEPGCELPSGPWFEYHHDRCVLPSSATLWASSPLAVQAFSIGRHVGVQFHPEIDDGQLARWFASMNGESRAHDDAEEALLARTRSETPAATSRAQVLVDLFLAHAGLEITT